MKTSILKNYLNEINKYKTLDYKNHVNLINRAVNGDTNAREEIIVRNLKLVVKIAREFQNKGLPLTDLISEGNLGLIKAVDDYRYNNDCAFRAYVSYCIKKRIRQALFNKAQETNVPKVTQQREAKKKTKSAKNIKSAEQQNRNCNFSSPIMISLDAPTSRRRQYFSLYQKIADKTELTPSDKIIREELAKYVNRLIYLLDTKEIDIINRRFGLVTGYSESLSNIAEDYNLSRERIRQITNEAIEKIKRMLECVETPYTQAPDKLIA